MTNIQLKETVNELKPHLFAVIDVGTKKLVLVFRKNGKPFDPQKFANSATDRARLVKKLVKLAGSQTQLTVRFWLEVSVCALESTVRLLLESCH